MFKRLISSGIFILLTPIIAYAILKDEAGIPTDNDNNYILFKNHHSLGEDESSFPFKIIHKLNTKNLHIHSCQDVPIGLRSCSQSLCYEDAPFGKIYRKIVGKEGDSCKYIERTRGFGGIDCSIPSEYIEKANYLFDKHFETLYNLNLNFTSNELKGLQTIYQHFCKVVPDQFLNMVVTIDEKKYAKDEISEILSTGETEVSSVSTKGKSGAKRFVKEEKPEGIKDAFKSIMFKQDDVDLILEVVGGFNDPLIAKKKGAYSASVIDKIKGGNIITFYLNSILYESKNNWVVWLNNYKLGYNAPPAAVSVVKVFPEYAEFKWSTNNLDKSSPNWQSKVEQISETEYITKDENIRIHTDGEQSKIIHFTLKPNQTFILQTLSVIEGRVQ